MSVLPALVLATLLPLAVLTRWTLALEPGKGPQGGEAIFLGWLVVALWLTGTSVAAAVRLAAHAPGFVRLAVAPVAALVASALFFWLVFALLNDATLAGVPAAKAHGQTWLAALLVGALVLLEAWILGRR